MLLFRSLKMATGSTGVREDCSELYGRAFEENFVEDVRSYRCLWDTTSGGFTDREMRNRAFEVLGEKYGKTADGARKTWKNFKENFSKCLRKRQLMMQAGAPAVSLPECKLFHQLQFLQGKLVNRSTTSKISNQCPSQNGPKESSSQTSSPASAPSPTPSLDSISRQPMKRKASETPPNTEKIIIITEKEPPDNVLYEGLQQKSELDADQSFTNSLVPILRSLPAKKNRLAKIEIQQLLLKYEFEDDE